MKHNKLRPATLPGETASNMNHLVFTTDSNLLKDVYFRHRFLQQVLAKQLHQRGVVPYAAGASQIIESWSTKSQNNLPVFLSVDAWHLQS
ncbi:MAG: hypothetical protein QN755_10055 [Nitrososphaeraceae archaeon]|nr:hypothetical protein [Nitrososphaeraceae archaeon]